MLLKDMFGKDQKESEISLPEISKGYYLLEGQPFNMFVEKIKKTCIVLVIYGLWGGHSS